ncbi:hypothetical protein ACJX0J_040425, partial [Zea mays]
LEILDMQMLMQILDVEALEAYFGLANIFLCFSLVYEASTGIKEGPFSTGLNSTDNEVIYTRKLLLLIRLFIFFGVLHLVFIPPHGNFSMSYKACPIPDLDDGIYRLPTTFLEYTFPIGMFLN